MRDKSMDEIYRRLNPLYDVDPGDQALTLETLTRHKLQGAIPYVKP